MKRRFLASLLAVAMLATMFAGFTAWADVEPATFIDTDMENNNTSYLPTGFGRTLVHDDTLQSTVAKYEVPMGTSFLSVRNNIDKEKYPNLAATGVLWGEISIKYVGAFTRLTWEHSQSSPPVWIDDDGSVRTGGWAVFNRDNNELGSDTGYDLELGKWYHIVSALDYKTSTNGTITIWINGKKIVNAATPYYRLYGTCGFSYIDFMLANAKGTASTVYIDNYRAYTTAAIDSHPENSALVDANSADGIGVTAEYITGASEATVAQVKSALKNGDKLSFVKGGKVLEADENVLGATAYAPLANGKGFRTYDVAGTHIEDFIDLDFNDWTKVKANDTDKNGNAFYWEYVNFAAPSVSVVTDAEKGNKVLKFDSTNPNGLAQFKHDLTGRDYFTRNESQWMEWSVKFEGGFTKVGYDHAGNVSPIYINANGELKRFAQAAVMYQFELDKWYHIVCLMDTVNAPTNDGGRLYVWINGEKIFNGTDYNSSFKVQADGGLANWEYYRFYVSTPKAGTNVYIDDVKAYSTGSGKNDTHAADDWNFDIADANENDGIRIAGGKIVAPEKSVADVKAAFTGVKLVAVDANDDDAAEGKTFYVWAANEYAYKTISVAYDDEAAIIKTYLDANIDNWTSGFDTKPSAGTVLDSSSQYFWRNDTADQTVQYSAEKGGKVLKIANIPTDEAATSFYTANRLNTGENTYDNCKVLWSEFSIKYEGGFKRFGFGEQNSAHSIFGINNEGTVIKFILNGGYKALKNFGTPVNAERLELGKWYHFVAALDFTDKDAAEKGAPLYIWMNGELIENGGRSTNFKPSTAWRYHKLWVSKYGSEAASIYLDNFKVYETSAVDTHAAKDFAISVIDENQDDDFYIEDDYIVIPEGATVAAVKAAIKAYNYVFVKNGVALSDDEPALGSIMTVNALNGIGFKQYEIVDRVIKDIIGPIGESAVAAISATIKPSNGVHPATGMINNGIYALKDGDVYKSAENVTDDLVVTITLDAYYALQNVTVHERWASGSVRSVTVDLGKNGVYKNVATDVQLTEGWNHMFSTPTVVSFDETEADTIRLTFKCIETTGDKQKYQIYEIEAEGYKSGDMPVFDKISGPVGESFVTSISTNIPSRISSSPILGMIDGNREFHSDYGGSDASYYKSSELYDENPLKVLLTLDGVYQISSIGLYERRPGQNPVTVSILAGKDGVFTEIASDVRLTDALWNAKAFETIVRVPWTDADAVMLVFENAGSYTGSESAYQISEIEVYGKKVGDVSSTAILPAYSFGELTNDKFIVSISNKTDDALEGVLLVAAYQGDELVGITTAKEISFGKGVTAEYTVNASGIIADGRTYKAFLWNNMDDAKPVLASKVITE